MPSHRVGPFRIPISYLFHRGDRGGKDIRLDDGGNLHSTWDRLLSNEATVGRVGRVGSVVDKLLQEAGEFGPDAARSKAPEEWLRESCDYARKLA